MFTINRSVVEASVKNKLEMKIEIAMEEVEYDDGEVEIDSNIKLYDDGIYITIYDLNHRLLIGHIPNELSNINNFNDNETRTENINGNQYYIYDRLITFKKHDSVWIRGIISVNSVTDSYQSLLSIALIILPILIIIAVMGGYQIAKRSLQPIEDIITTVDSINEGKDLSQRITNKSSTNEIRRLITTFNNMFERLEKSFIMERQFTQDASHELRTPVSVILAECDYNIHHVDMIGEYKESIETINRQAEKMRNLINQLLSIARFDQEMVDKTFELINYSELLQIICEEQEILYPEINLSKDIEPDISITSSHTLLSRVCVNLISNAFTYNNKGGHVHVNLFKENDKIILKIRDDGIGIDENDIDKIWDRFYRADNSRTTSNNLGLGLSMVKMITEFIHGEIYVESKKNVGSVFTLILL